MFQLAVRYCFDQGINELDSLEIKKKNFNYNKELSKYFKGSKLVEAADESSMNKRQKAYVKQMRMKNKPKKKYALVHNEDIFTTLPDRLLME